MKAIEIQGLTKQFGKLVAVDDLDLAVEEGESFGFLGPNGAGKTTTIRMLIGLLRPTRGTVRIWGHDLFAEGKEVKKSFLFLILPFIFPSYTYRKVRIFLRVDFDFSIAPNRCLLTHLSNQCSKRGTPATSLTMIRKHGAPKGLPCEAPYYYV